MRFRSFAAGAALLSLVAGSAVAQPAPATTPVAPAVTPSDTATPPDEVKTPMPDTGLKKTPDSKPVHHRIHRHSHVKPGSEATSPDTAPKQ